MMLVENLKAYGMADALRGMRNPLNSWAKADSHCVCDPTDGHVVEFHLGPNDEKLCKALTVGGPPHRKFLRQITVTMDITAPMYWWAEMDTYKICTTRNSCSVQHKGASRDFVVEDFTFDSISFDGDEKLETEVKSEMKTLLEAINDLRRKYVETKDYKYFRLMRQFLPSSYNYKTTWSGNYEVLLNIYKWRKHHKLLEWHEFCDAFQKLPGMNFFLGLEKIETT